MHKYNARLWRDVDVQARNKNDSKNSITFKGLNKVVALVKGFLCFKVV